MKNNYRKAIIFILSLFAFFLLITNFHSNAKATTATNTTKEEDVSLILDISGDLSSKSKEEINTYCLDFCKNILDKSSSNKISIITPSNSESTPNFTSDINVLKNILNSQNASAITDLNEYLSESDKLFSNSSTNAEKSIIILSNENLNDDSFNSDKYNSREDYVTKTSNLFENISSKYKIYSLSYQINSAKNHTPLLQNTSQNIKSENYYKATNSKSLSSSLKKISNEIVQEPPIIIIPGIIGSHLYKDSDCSIQIWDPPVDLNPFNENSIYNLGSNIKIDSTLFAKKAEDEVPLSTSEREYGAQNAYKNFVDTVCSEFPGREVYFFSYDFRKSNVSAGEQLKDFIDNTLNASKVDLICHSMGGIVASNYATLDTSKIDKVITLGTPYEGAPTLINAVLNWSILSEDWNTTDFALGVCGLTKKVKAGFTGVSELYPTKNYFNQVGFSSKFTDGLFLSHIYPIDYGKYEEYGNTIFGDNYASSISEQERILSNGSNILSTLSNSYFAIGTGEKTISSLVFKDGNTLDSIDVDSLIYENNGDGTVPNLSSTMLGKLNNINSNNVKYFTETTHGGLINNTDPINWTIDILKQGTSTLGSKTMALGKPYIVMRIDSPTTAAVEKNDEILNTTNNITSYSSYGRLDRIGENGEIQMAAIDEDNNYNITLNGTDNGKMDYSISWFDENNNLEEEREFKDVSIEKGTTITTTTDKSNPTQLLIDKDDNGKVDDIIESDKDNKNGKAVVASNDSDTNSKTLDETSPEPVAENTSLVEEQAPSNNINFNIIAYIVIIAAISSILTLTIIIRKKKKK